MSLVGLEKWELDTPSLLIDLDTMEKNIAKMAEYYKGLKCTVRPHIKTHKSPIIAHKQLEAGAIGITCQKVGEAEVMANAGIRDILISNQVANKHKINRVVGLAKHCDLVVGVDNLENARQLSRAAQNAGIRLNIALEIYAGRCGVQAGEPAVQLAKEILSLKGLKLKGAWIHKGLAGIKNFEERMQRELENVEPLLRTKDLLEDAGIVLEFLSAGATATWNITPKARGVTDVQSGSYVFMDASYKLIEGTEPFTCALTILGTVISRPTADRAIIDIGLKSNGIHYGVRSPPIIKDVDGVEVLSFSEEHATLKLKHPSLDFNVGNRLEFIPSHCCTTVNLFNEYVGIREEMVEVVWPISARGKTQ